MEKWKKRAVDLLTSIAFGSDGDGSVVPYYPQKTEVSSYEFKYFHRTTPERQGISSKRLYNMLCELESEKRANVHSIMVVRGGEVILECSRDGYDVNTAHLSHSMTKSVTGLAVGMLSDEGKLRVNTRLVDIFPEFSYRDKRFATMTVGHLLSMKSGVAFAEAGSVTDRDWLETFFSSSMKFAPGARFSYNSMNSYVLGRIVSKISGESLSEFLEKRLFTPLGITNYFWEKGPEGIEKGGWGLYLSTESWAKIGSMVLRGGVFNDTRIISSEWISAATSLQSKTPEILGDYDYGYQTWVGRQTKEILFNGMLGQNVWICPENDIVAVIMSGNNEMFQESPALEIVRKYLSSELSDTLDKRDFRVLADKESKFFDSRRWVRPLPKKRGFSYWLGMRPRWEFDKRWESILGTYAFAKNSIGLLPLIVRGMQNNMAAKLEAVSLDRHGERLFMTVRESGASYHIEIGLYGYKETVLDFRGEKYIVKAMGEPLLDGDGDGEFRIELLFPELPNTRMITIERPDLDTAIFKFTEVPNNRIIETLFDRVTASPALGFALDLFERRFGEDFIHKRIEGIFAPELVGVDTNSEDYEEIIKRERESSAKESVGVKILRAVVDKFFRIEDVVTAPSDLQDTAKKND